MKKRICKHCSNKARPGRTDCNTCHSRKKDSKNPIRKAYRNKKADAKRKGIPFDLTFEQFKKFAVEYDYMRSRGNQSRCYAIDRIERYWPNGEVRGYDVDNIQVLQNGINIRKYALLEKYYDGQKMHWSVNKQNFQTESLAPF